MKDKAKVLLVSPYSAKRVGGIGTWTKIVLDYCGNSSDCEIITLNTSQGFPKRWSRINRFVYVFIGFLDSFFILIRLFWKMLLKCPSVVHYTSSAGNALYKDNIAIWIVKKLFHKKFVIHWHFGRIPAIFEEKKKEYYSFIKVCNSADISIVIDICSYNILRNNNIETVYIPNPIPIELQKEAGSLSDKDLKSSRKKGEVLFVFKT